MPFAVGPQPNFLPGLLAIGKKIIGGIIAGKVSERLGGGRVVEEVTGNVGTAATPVPAMPPVQTAGLGGAVGRVISGQIAKRGGLRTIGIDTAIGTGVGVGAGLLFGRGGGTGGQIKPILDEARANTGVPVTSKKIAKHIRDFGFEASSDFFGLNLEQLSIIWMHVSRRRRKRFTAKDKARARSYIRHLQAQERELNKLRPRAKRRTYRRRTPSTQLIKQ